MTMKASVHSHAFVVHAGALKIPRPASRTMTATFAAAIAFLAVKPVAIGDGAHASMISATSEKTKKPVAPIV